MKGFVYFLRCGDFVKIGYSTDPQRRLRYLQTATPFSFEILGAHVGTRQHEQQLHKIFAPLRHRHEWFRIDQCILEIAATGLPSMDVQAPVSNSLGEFLKLSKITQTGFAAKIGMTQRAVSLWVRGDRTPRAKQMQKIITATDGAVTPNDFLPSPPVNEAAQ